MNKEHKAMWYEERVEAFVDGDLAANEATLFAARLRHDPALKQSVKSAIGLQSALAALPGERCPKAVSRRVFAETGAGWRLNRSWTWAAVATAAVFVVALNLALLGPLRVDPAQPTAAELARARQDLAVAMAYLDRASNIASREIGRQIVTSGIVRPVAVGLNRTLPARRTARMEDAS